MSPNFGVCLACVWKTGWKKLSLDAERMALTCLAFGDALDLGGVQCVELVLVPGLLLAKNAGAIQRSVELLAQLLGNAAARQFELIHGMRRASTASGCDRSIICSIPALKNSSVAIAVALISPGF